MKTEKIRTDKIWEFRLAINDYKRLQALNDFWEQNKKKFRSKNCMLNTLIFEGLNLEKIYEKDIDIYKETAEISDKLSELKQLLSTTLDWEFKGTKENYRFHNESQILLQRIYHVLMRFAKEKGMSEENYNKGIFDGMPDGFEEMQEEIKVQADDFYGN